ncbi:unnamed protein product [Brassica rapa subsp. trilocularis]
METEQHIFLECPFAKMLWRASGISNTVINSSNATLDAKIEVCLTCCSTRMSHLLKLLFGFFGDYGRVGII